MIANMHLSKKMLLIITIALLLIILIVFFSTNKFDSTIKNKDSKIKIGLLFDSNVVERWSKDEAAFVSTARKLGAEISVKYSYGDCFAQLNQFNEFIENNYDVIVIVPIKSDVLIDAVEEAHKHDIFVISYDRLLTNCNSDLYISFDNENVGELMGESIKDMLIKNTKVVMICGPDTDKNVSFVAKGFENYLKKHNVDISDKYNLAEWKSELASEYIESHPNIIKESTIIMCGNDNLASAVISSLVKLHFSDKIVLGQDGDLSACQRIVEGSQYMTVYKPVNKLAEKTATISVHLANGLSLSDIYSVSETINDGTYDIPYIKLSPVSVTKENMNETIISSGFHLKQKVYQNVKNISY